MAITAEARTEIITLVVGMFGASPGANILDQLVTAEQSGASLKQIAAAIADSAEFASIYPSFMTNAEFAADFVDNIVGSEVPSADKSAAAADIVAALDAGASRTDVMVDAIFLLNSVPEDHPVWGNGAARLHNQTEVAEYHAVTLEQSGGSLQELQNIVATVTSDDATAEAAIEDLGEGTNPGEEFELTTGPNEFNGFAGDDVFNAVPVDSNGVAADTFSGFDKLDGGAGNDTLNIFTAGGKNAVFPGSSSVKNIEMVNILNETAAGAFGDAAKFEGVTELWQHNFATAVTNLGNETTAGFSEISTGTALSTTGTAAATDANVSLTNVHDGSTLAVAGAKLNTVNVSGNLVTAAGAASALALGVTATLGNGVETATVNLGIDSNLVIENAGGKDLKSIDASKSTGDITYTGADAQVQTIKTGTGDDTLVTQTATTAAIAAMVESGEGDDDVTVTTSGVGTTTVNAGAGDDVVNVTGRSDAKLTLNLGAGDDSVSVTGGVINATDDVNGGEGTDTLLLSIVGAANIGAFSNFEVFDAVGLGKNLDIDILSSKNTVTEIITTGDVGAGASLSNLGADVGYRVTGDTAIANSLTLNQKAAGDLAVTLDIDESGTTAATTAAGDADAWVVASNATAITATFDSDFVGEATGAGDNEAEFLIDGEAATELTVVSNGENAINTLTYADTSGSNKLDTVTVTGASDLELSLTGSTNIETVDASGLTGGLTFNAADLKAESAANEFDGGVIKLGSGDDLITVVTGTKISGFGLGEEEDATAQDGFDVIVGGGAQATDNATAAAELEDGLITFLGAGPNDLDAAIADATAVAAGSGAAVFEYIGNSYLINGANVVQLVGLTGLQGLDNVDGTTDVYVF